MKVDEWVFWQMANFGPNAGQRNHFRNYAPSFIHDQRQVAYGAIRYTNEVHRLYGVLDGSWRAGTSSPATTRSPT